MADSSQATRDDLETLARARFGALSEAELMLLRAAPQGKGAVCGPNANPSDPANDPANADNWGSEREIRANLIRWLSVDAEAAKEVDPKGLRVFAAKVTGKLDLSFAAVPFPVFFVRCRLMEDADLTSVQIPLLSLAGSRTRSIHADRARVTGSVFLKDKFAAEGEVRLLGARIGGNLECDGGTFKNPRTSENPQAKALNADGARVTGYVFLRDKFTAEGEVWLLGAQIGGQLDCSGGTFKNPGGKALIAVRARVTGDVFLNHKFTAEGEVRLLGAQIDGDLDCSGGTFSALNAERAVVKRALWWKNVKKAEGAELDLMNASAGAIVDDQASWPSKGKLFLDGFTYDRITAGPTDANSRLEWLERVDEFTLQPYQQLAKVLRETGDTRGARQVLFEMERRRRKEKDRNWLARLWSWVLRWTMGYGQMPGRALGWLAGLWLLGFMFSGLGYLGGAMAPSQKDAYEIFQQQGQPPAYYPRFCAPVYSLDHSFPFVNLGQKDFWAPNQGVSPRLPALRWHFLESVRAVTLRGVHPLWFPYPGILRVWFWLQILAGWVLATLFVAGLTGIVRSG